MVTGSPGLRTVLGAVFAVDGPVGAVVERLHALHHPGLVAKLSAGLAAGTPLFHHPPVSTAHSLKRFPCHTVIRLHSFLNLSGKVLLQNGMNEVGNLEAKVLLLERGWS